MDFGSISNVEHVTSQRARLNKLLQKHAFFKYVTQKRESLQIVQL